MVTKIVQTACQLCSGCCGMNAYVEDGKIVKLEGMPDHPANHGKLCPKGATATDMVYSPQRLQYPMKREGDQWKRISWDEALDTIATKLEKVKQEFGPQSAVVSMGMVQLTQGIGSQGLIRRFTDLYGTPNVFSVDSMCFRCRLIGHILMSGKYSIADPENAKTILVWANNPEDSAPYYSWIMQRALAKKPKLIVIDPRRTALAKKADIHAQPRPGTDGALALGMLNVIIGEKLYDANFVEKYTVGFEQLAEHVKQYSPEKVAGITRVPAQTIRDMARMFATNQPSTIVQGTNPLDQQASGVHNSRLIVALECLTGNFEVAGGYVTTPGLRISDFRFPDKMQGTPIGLEKFPLFYGVFGRMFGESQSMLLPDHILTENPYPIKAAIISGSNPMSTWPNTNKLRKALQKLDLLVVMDLFLTETARLAHIVLPAASFLERTDLVDMYRLMFPCPFVMLRKKVIEPVGESWADLKFWMELGKRMGYGEHFPWKDPEEALDWMLKPSGLTVRHLTETKPEGAFIGTMKYKIYEQKGFQTPSGKVELYSEALAKMGREPLPTFKENPESPVSQPALAKEYPLVLTTGARILPFLHSQLRNIPRMRRRFPEAVVEVHPDTAAKYNVSDGDMVTVSTKRGSIDVKAKITSDIITDVLNIAHGWGEANVNELTDETPADAISGYPALKGLLCKMERKKG